MGVPIVGKICVDKQDMIRRIYDYMMSNGA